MKTQQTTKHKDTGKAVSQEPISSLQINSAVFLPACLVLTEVQWTINAGSTICAFSRKSFFIAIGV